MKNRGLTPYDLRRGQRLSLENEWEWEIFERKNPPGFTKWRWWIWKDDVELGSATFSGLVLCRCDCFHLYHVCILFYDTLRLQIAQALPVPYYFHCPFSSLGPSIVQWSEAKFVGDSVTLLFPMSYTSHPRTRKICCHLLGKNKVLHHITLSKLAV